jgi:hypothetical protein
MTLQVGENIMQAAASQNTPSKCAPKVFCTLPQRLYAITPTCWQQQLEHALAWSVCCLAGFHHKGAGI